MSRETGFEDWGNRPFSSAVVSKLMPDVDVSDRTYSTYQIGAIEIIKHLMVGDWEIANERDTQLVKEFLGRVASNAVRQGVEVSGWEKPDIKEFDIKWDKVSERLKKKYKDAGWDYVSGKAYRADNSTVPVALFTRDLNGVDFDINTIIRKLNLYDESGKNLLQGFGVSVNGRKNNTSLTIERVGTKNSQFRALAENLIEWGNELKIPSTQ